LNLSKKLPYFDIPWHPYSDQPQRIDPALKWRMRWWSLPEYARTAATALTFAPLAALRYASMTQPRPGANSPRDFIGLGMSIDSTTPDAQLALVSELGVRHVLVRFPVWHRDRIDDYVRFLSGMPQCSIVISILQDRASVCDLAGWKEDLRLAFHAFGSRVQYFQIGQAPNRTKWGCSNFGEFALLLETAESLRREFPQVRFVGPALIDFEPVAMLRSLINLRRYSIDVVSALLYVDRRGAPSNRQYGYFDLVRKIRLQAALASLSPRCVERGPQRLWITEVNWPIKNNGEYAPTSQDECVSESDYAANMRGYYQQAYATGLVERVYWWQLVAPGYGLVDRYQGVLKKRDAFEQFKKMISGEIALGTGR
jgi:hypothetical protein